MWAFARGGNAVDAAIAANAAIAVTGPHLCGMGGDLFAIVSTPGGDLVGLNASGRAGSGADAAALRAEGFTAMPFRGDVRSVTIPGCVDGWTALHERFGLLDLDVVAPAIRLAADGVPGRAAARPRRHVPRRRRRARARTSSPTRRCAGRARAPAGRGPHPAGDRPRAAATPSTAARSARGSCSAAPGCSTPTDLEQQPGATGSTCSPIEVFGVELRSSAAELAGLPRRWASPGWLPTPGCPASPDDVVVGPPARRGRRRRRRTTAPTAPRGCRRRRASSPTCMRRGETLDPRRARRAADPHVRAATRPTCAPPTPTGGRSA